MSVVDKILHNERILTGIDFRFLLSTVCFVMRFLVRFLRDLLLLLGRQDRQLSCRPSSKYPNDLIAPGRS